MEVEMGMKGTKERKLMKPSTPRSMESNVYQQSRPSPIQTNNSLSTTGSHNLKWRRENPASPQEMTFNHFKKKEKKYGMEPPLHEYKEKYPVPEDNKYRRLALTRDKLINRSPLNLPHSIKKEPMNTKKSLWSTSQGVSANLNKSTSRKHGQDVHSEVHPVEQNTATQRWRMNDESQKKMHIGSSSQCYQMMGRQVQ